MLRILQVVTDDDRRGAQVFATDLEAALRTIGHDVTTVALAPGTHAGKRLGVDILGSSRLARSTLGALRGRARSTDVVVAHGSSTLTAATLAGLGRGGKPFVYRQISDSVFWANTLRRRVQVAVGLRRADHIVALSSEAAATLVQHVWAPSRRITVVPNGVPSSGFRPANNAERRSARLTLGLRDDVATILFIGALVPEKGARAAVDAVATTTGQLIVAGDGPERRELETYARGLLGDRVVFTGSVSDTAPIYRAADVVGLPSRGGDSMPATLIEAGFCALPSVATPIGSITEVVRHGETGLVTPVNDDAAFADAIRSLLDDPIRAAAMGIRARDYCRERFDINVVAAQWSEVLVNAARRG